MPLTIDQIIRLYRTKGAARYGMVEIDQEQHALQCAPLAVIAGPRGRSRDQRASSSR